MFYYRNIFDLVESIFSDPYLENDMVLTPSKYYRGTERIYSEMHTADWWHEMQVKQKCLYTYHSFFIISYNIII